VFETLCLKEMWDDSAHADSKGFRQWCVTLRITRFLAFVHHHVCWGFLEHQTVEKVQKPSNPGTGHVYN
jgi:hypothetical protein